ncbi:MAG TPA: MarR family transcriptional regulator [Acidimicrobiales bacterium]|nr:MarR family transcriptional regulator [Acidimicrobiales bacterium]
MEALRLPNGGAGHVRRAVTHLARRLRAERSDISVSSGKLSLLSHLVRRGPLTPGELAAAEFVQPQSLTRVLADLEEAGLVERSPHHDDGRRYVVAITANGREVLSRDMEGRDRWLAEAMVGLTQTERDVLRIAATLMERMADT